MRPIRVVNVSDVVLLSPPHRDMPISQLAQPPWPTPGGLYTSLYIFVPPSCLSPGGLYSQISMYALLYNFVPLLIPLGHSEGPTCESVEVVREENMNHTVWMTETLPSKKAGKNGALGAPPPPHQSAADGCCSQPHHLSEVAGSEARV